MSGKRSIVIACVITFIVTIAVTVAGLMVFNVGIGDKIFVSQKDYQEVTKIAKKYANLDYLTRFLEDNYYEKLTEDQLMIGVYKGLFEGTGDGYTQYFTEEEYNKVKDSYSGEIEGIGVVIGMHAEGYAEVISVIEDGPAESAGIISGDLIIRIDGESCIGAKTSEVAAMLKGDSGTTVEVTISRNQVLRDCSIVRSSIPNITVTDAMLDEDTGYIRISSFKENTAADFKASLEKIEAAGASKLVIDIRSNGGGLVTEAVESVDMLMDEGTIIYTQDGKGEKQYYTAKNGRTKLKYDVLVNGASASAAEIFAAGIQGNDEGTIIGTQTYGKGITQRTWSLGSGAGISITIAQYFGPNGEVIHGKGITPDIIVDYLESDIEDGVVVNDRQLNEAIKYLKENM